MVLKSKKESSLWGSGGEAGCVKSQKVGCGLSQDVANGAKNMRKRVWTQGD